MNGAPSQVDTFDPKPALDKFDGTPYRGKTPVGSNNRPVGRLMKSPFKFSKHGESGLDVSDLPWSMAKFADDLCVIRSLHTDTAAHASGCLQMNTGSVLRALARPWLSYGSAARPRICSSFVVMTDPRGGLIALLELAVLVMAARSPYQGDFLFRARVRRCWTSPLRPASRPRSIQGTRPSARRH